MSFRNCIFICMTAALAAASCMAGKGLADLERAAESVSLSLAGHDEPPLCRDSVINVQVDSSSPRRDGPLLMKAVRDDETGEMVATDVIVASKVTARFRNVAERLGRVEIQFDMTVPQGLVRSDLQLKFNPVMKLYGRRISPETGEPETVMTDSSLLEPVYITGNAYRQKQLRGYERYEAFLATIIGDTTEFVREKQLEQFIRRHFPEIYAMKDDSSYVYDNDAENIFGVNLRTVREHYTDKIMKARNERRISDRDRMFRKYVKDPIVGNIRLDTVLASSEGALVYRYVQDVAAVPMMKRIVIGLDGSIWRNGENLCALAGIDSLVFYVSSLASLADDTPRYVFRIMERRVTDHTNAYIDFESGSSVFDSLAPGNASELERIRKSFAEAGSDGNLVLDSVVVTASCSPEGDYGFNKRLAQRRSLAVMRYFSDVFEEKRIADCMKSSSVPENWEYFCTLVKNDTVLGEDVKAIVAEAGAEEDKEAAELRLSRLPEYRYMREKIYPRLRTVRFDFHLHRKGMAKDTVHTTEPDTVYMKGVNALKNMDYKTAATLLKPYGDYNSALAMASSGYDESALAILRTLDWRNAKVSYLTSLVLARMGRYREAAECYKESVSADPAMAHRANLDPEMSGILDYADDKHN